MHNQNKLDKELKQLKALDTLVDVYGEIASNRMMKIRSYVLKNREFLGAINNIFEATLAVFIKRNVLEQKTNERITFLPHNGKSVGVFIAANTGFYGEIVHKNFNKFAKDIKASNMEATIIGRVGVSLFESRFPGRPFTYFELEDYGIDKSKLQEVIKHLVQYEEINVYYGEYKSVVTQEAAVANISSGTRAASAAKSSDDYIFEPDIEKILMFFETQVFVSLFDQTLRESQLSKYASRILAMDSASENIKETLSKVELERLMLRHGEENKKQINRLASTYSAFGGANIGTK